MNFFFVTKLAHTIQSDHGSTEFTKLIGVEAENYKKACAVINEHLLTELGGIENEEIDFSLPMEVIAEKYNLLFVEGKTLIHLEASDSHAGISHTAEIIQQAYCVSEAYFTCLLEWADMVKLN